MALINADFVRKVNRAMERHRLLAKTDPKGLTCWLLGVESKGIKPDRALCYLQKTFRVSTGWTLMERLGLLEDFLFRRIRSC